MNAYVTFNHTCRTCKSQRPLVLMQVDSLLLQNVGLILEKVQVLSLWHTTSSVTPAVWVCGGLHIFAQHKQQTADMHVSIHLRVRVYHIMNTN